MASLSRLFVAFAAAVTSIVLGPRGVVVPPKTPTLTFVVLGDNRPARPTDSQPKAFFQLMNMARQEHPAFVVSTGDIVTDSIIYPGAVARQYRQLEGAVRRLGVPFYVARGNHDSVNRRLYKAFTRRPLYYRFSRGDAGFWILDTEAGDAVGSINDRQFAWLAGSLVRPEYRWRFVFLHRPLLLPKEANRVPPGHVEFEDPVRASRLRSLFAQTRVTIVFEGHVHAFEHQRTSETDYIITGGGGAGLYADESHGGFLHYVVVKVNAAGVQAELVRLNGERRPILWRRMPARTSPLFGAGLRRDERPDRGLGPISAARYSR